MQKLAQGLAYFLGIGPGSALGSGKRQNGLHLAWVFGLGALHAFSFSSPWQGVSLWPLQLFCLAVWYAQLTRCHHWRQGLLLGFAFAWGWMGAGLWWVFISLHVYGHLASLLAALAVAVLTAFFALYYALAAALYVYLARRACVSGLTHPNHLSFTKQPPTNLSSVPSLAGVAKPLQNSLNNLPEAPKTPAFSVHPLACAVLWAALVLCAELARASFLTGFPWLSVGYAQLDGPFQALAPWVGVYGMGFVVVLCVALLVQGLQSLGLTPGPHRKVCLGNKLGRAVLSLGVLCLGVALAWQVDFSKPPPPHKIPLSVALLQGNTPQLLRLGPVLNSPMDAMAWYANALQTTQAQLSITPETAFRLPPQYFPEGYWAKLSQKFAAPNSTQAALIGLNLGNFQTGFSNAIVGLSPHPPAEGPYLYTKHHLVPFGEYVPPFLQWFTQAVGTFSVGFQAGPVDQASFTFRGERFAPLICVEDLFGEELAQRFTNPAQIPTILVSMSNLGWFGNTSVLVQHLNQSRMRALEFARPILRVSNTGTTAIIGADGQVKQMLPRFTAGVLQGHVFGNTPLTPYAWWLGHFGLWPLWALGLGIIALWVLFFQPRGRCLSQQNGPRH